ncbi:hypothetical protein PG993_001528 [Apiospora rasikravindrae]|uniref:Uncharacterized protein n=1 Tax=Apiospora rasikravindrae TaxID=990691 RepID=A0ABR1UDR4_9PEZI
MLPLQCGAATLPRGFRLPPSERDPRTPEPSAPMDEMPPSPPRPRLKLKRRNITTQLSAPTQQFLASVAAADVPIPSVEEPSFINTDEDMVDDLSEVDMIEQDNTGLFEQLRARAFSPPKTPAADVASTLLASEYPDWSIESCWSGSDAASSPEYESSRPSTAFSTQTSASSLYSQFSHASDDDDCQCPNASGPECDDSDSALPIAPATRSRKPRRAPWTKAMSAHLWSTYMLYLQDPRVTPFRLGKSRIPPEGVCNRVAREAKRSWKGSNAVTPVNRDSTPTAESSKPFIQWPHTCATTKAQLRELCRLKASSQPGKAMYTSRSPTPFQIAAHRRWNRRHGPPRSPSVFSAQDMAMSLTLSTSETMQPHGPLAQLTCSQPEPEVMSTPTAASSATASEHALEDLPSANRRRLASPFFARSYGPSSSNPVVGIADVRRQPHTVGARKLLKSPVRLARSKSGTQKRRSVKSLEDQPRRRPSLSGALWGFPPTEPESQAGNKTLFSSTASAEHDSMFIPRSTAMPDPFAPAEPSSSAGLSVAAAAPQVPRLGSPFGASHSFPNRLSQPLGFNLTALRRGFATVQQPSETNPPSTPSRSSLASRLAYIDQRLKDFRSRNNVPRRSQSPW